MARKSTPLATPRQQHSGTHVVGPSKGFEYSSTSPELPQLDSLRVQVNHPLASEMKTFEKIKPQLLHRAGKFAVIFGERFIGAFSTWEDGLEAGYAVAGLKPFMVKKIERDNPTQVFRPMQCPT